MSNFSPMRAARLGLRRCVRRVLGRTTELRVQWDDLSYAAGRTVHLDELLVRIPSQICEAFHLQHFSILLRRDAAYVLQSSAGPRVAIRTSSAVVAQLKRERRLLLLNKPEPDGWRLLATADEVEQLGLLEAEALLPLTGRTGLVGFAAVAASGTMGSLEKNARKLEELAAHLGLGLETAQFQRSLQEEATQRERMTRSLELAREVQERMLPQQLPREPLLDTAASYQSAEQVGGDYYDAFRTPGGKLCYIIADVSGKGTSAALLMATLRAAMRTAMLQEPELPGLLRTVNGLLYEASSSSRYATLAVLRIDPATGTVASCNAGHNPPLLLQGETHRELSAGGPVLGLLPDAEFEQEVFTLTAGDTLLLYTDGVTEWTDGNDEEWGKAGLLEAALSAPSSGAHAWLHHVLARLAAFAGKVPQNDDTTLLVLQARAPEQR